MQGDLHEWFFRRVERQGLLRARLLYFIDVIRFFRTFRLRSIKNSKTANMTGHNIKITWRSLKKDRLSAFLRIGNLTLGMVCFLLILVYVNYESGYDQYHAKAANTYRLQHELRGDPWAATPVGVGPYALENFAGIEEMARFQRVSRSWVKYQDKIFIEGDIFFADTSAFSIFDFEVVNGNSEDPLQLVHGAVLTESMAKKYYGDEDPIGKEITLEQDRGHTRVVTAIIKDIDPQSHFTFDMLLPMHVLRDERLREFRNWGTYTYVVASPEADLQSIAAGISEEYTRQYGGPGVQAKLMALTDIHLKSNAEKEITANSKIEYIYILSFAALFVLVIAIINFANLTIVKGVSRGKEVGVKKTLGALRGQLSNQFLTEIFTIILVSSLISLVGVYVVLPVFRDFSGLPIPLTTILSPYILLPLVVIILLTGLFCGYIPARIFSGYKTAEVIKSKVSGDNTRIGITRKTLIVVQFMVSTVLIVGSITIYKQLSHIQNTSMGFDHDQVVTVPFNREMRQGFEAFRQGLLTYASVEEVSSSSHAPGYRIMIEGIRKGGEEPEDATNMRVVAASPEFTKAYGLELVAGSDFTRSELVEGSWEFVINESAKQELFGEDAAVGKTVAWGDREGAVVGVVSDFNFQSFHEAIGPLAIIRDKGWIRYSAVRFNATSAEAAVEAITKTGETVFPDLPPIEFEFLDKRFDHLYLAENRLQAIVLVFCIISLLLTFSGILGLAIFIAQGKTKEVAIRKVLGSPTTRIISLMSRSFMFMAGVSLLLSIPTSVYMVNWWLSNFAYQIEPGMGIYILAIVSLLVVVFLSSAYTTIKAAVANPVDALRSE